MKPKIRTPYFEIGTKNYIYGDTVLEYAKAADAAAEKYDIDVLFITPAVEIRRVVENTRRLIVLAPYMDTLRPGRGMADILPEGLKAAGAKGVVINHCEKPMSLPAMKATIDRARELDFLVFACADTVDEAKAIAQLHPDIINPEPTELIGGAGGGVSDMGYVREMLREIKAIDPNIMVEQAAGITNGQQVYDFIMAGSEAAGAASGKIVVSTEFFIDLRLPSPLRRGAPPPFGRGGCRIGLRTALRVRSAPQAVVLPVAYSDKATFQVGLPAPVPVRKKHTATTCPSPLTERARRPPSTPAGGLPLPGRAFRPPRRGRHRRGATSGWVSFD